MWQIIIIDCICDVFVTCLANYAENCSSVVQDEVQGYYWSEEQHTVQQIDRYVKIRDENLPQTLFVSFRIIY